jgi:hypothetical protein
VKVFRLRRLNAAEAAAHKTNELLSLVQREAQPEVREQQHGQLSRAHRRSSKNVVASQREYPVKSQIGREAAQNKFRRRIASKDLSVSGSARPRLPAQVNASSAAEASHLDIGNRSRRLLVAAPRAQHAANEKECRARTVSRRHNNSLSYSSSNHSEAARLREPSTNRDNGNRKVELSANQKKRHRHSHDNFVG